MNKPPQKVLIPIAVYIALLCLALLRYSPILAAAASCGALLLLLLCYSRLREKYQESQRRMDRVLDENTSAAGKLISLVNVPSMIFNEQGRVIWRNLAMQKLFSGTDIRQLPAACNPRLPIQSATMEYQSGAYHVINMPVQRKHEASRPLTFQYWQDRTETEHYRRLYEEQRPYVALIYVDNYEELAADKQYQRNTVLAAVERLVSATATSVEGLYRRYDNGRFILVFEARHLAQMEQERFALLEKAHKLETGTGHTVTLSIAVGAASRIAQADNDARQAMELALGRGGDQAVVKNGTIYQFYGGRRQLESAQSRVKTRLFAKALRQLMENSTEVFIMGHKQPDMDCIGSALGIARCAIQEGCHAYIVLDQINPTIQQAVNAMRGNPAYAGMLLAPDAVRGIMRASSMLVVVDTQRASSTIAPELLRLAGKLVLIDHHRRSADYIDNSTLNYLDSRASSTSEMVTETLQYFDDNIRPTAFESSSLLAGITVDTKHFSFNVGARTFEAAAYLRHHGADSGMVKEMFQDDKQTYSDRVDTVKNASVISPGIALAACQAHTPNAPLIAAQAADELICIRGIDTAFALGLDNDGVNVSGRSLGRVNVQVILERLGGGGHLTIAGAQLKNTTLEEAAALVTSATLAYMDEQENSKGDSI